MSDISDVARVQIFIADYAIADASNKINALGVGFQVSVIQQTAATAAQAIVAIVEVPPLHVGEDMAVELGLYDDGSQLVHGRDPLGQEGEPVRFAQNVTLQLPVAVLPGFRIPRDALWLRHQIVIGLPMGIPVTAGQGYEWRLSIDTVTKNDWASRFYVPGPAGGVVVG